MLEKAAEHTPVPLPPPMVPGATGFARDPAELTRYRPALTLIDGGEGAR
jgi:hypothetical protein